MKQYIGYVATAVIAASLAGGGVFGWQRLSTNEVVKTDSDLVLQAAKDSHEAPERDDYSAKYEVIDIAANFARVKVIAGGPEYVLYMKKVNGSWLVLNDGDTQLLGVFQNYGVPANWYSADEVACRFGGKSLYNTILGGVKMYEGPAGDSRETGYIPHGRRVEVACQKGGWLKVAYMGLTGYVLASGFSQNEPNEFDPIAAATCTTDHIVYARQNEAARGQQPEDLDKSSLVVKGNVVTWSVKPGYVLVNGYVFVGEDRFSLPATGRGSHTSAGMPTYVVLCVTPASR